MKKTYRNALRSKAMIRQAFLELLAEKPLEKITVVDIVERCDLSRNTFYAHYQDTYAVLEEFQQEALESMKGALDDAVANRVFDDPLPFLHKVAEYIEDNKDSYRILLGAGGHKAFTEKVRDMLVKRIVEHIDDVGIRDKQGLLVFVQILGAGFMELFMQYLRGETHMTPEDIALQTSRIFQTGIILYR